jgi:hypothetical protein
MDVRNIHAGSHHNETSVFKNCVYLEFRLFVSGSGSWMCDLGDTLVQVRC